MKDADNVFCLLFSCCLQGKFQTDAFALIYFLVFRSEVIGRRQYPAAGTADGCITDHNTVVLQKLKLIFRKLLHLF